MLEDDRAHMLRYAAPTAITLNGQAADDARVAAVYRCRVPMDELQATDHPDIKCCDKCKLKVFKVNDFDGFEKAVASRGCVWGPVNVRSPVGGDFRPHFFGGATLLPYGAGSTLTWDE